MKFKSIAMRIFIFVIPIVLITTVLFIGMSYYISSSHINSTINEKMSESLRVADLQIQLELYKNAAVANNFASYGALLKKDTFSHEEHKNFLANGIQSNENTFGGGVWFEPFAFDSHSYFFGPFLYVEDDGSVTYVPDYGDRVDYYQEEWYIKGKSANNEIVWSDVYEDQVSFITMVTATKPFYNKDGKFMGVATSDMNLYNIQKIVNGISVGKTGKAFILGSNGEYLSFFNEGKSVSDAMQTDTDTALAQLGQELMANQSGMTTFIWNDKKMRVYYTTMENVNWKLAMSFEESEIQSSTLSSFLIMTGVPILGLLLVILSIILIVRYLRRIIQKVNNFADLAASGDFSKRIEVSETDEFGFMEKRLNTMISNMSDMRIHSAQLLEIAEKASKAKGEFLSRMSHEIRTPMNAVIGMTQIAKSSNDIVKIKDCLDKIDNASKHLLALLNDILDMSKIEANKLELFEEEFDLAQTFANITNIISVKVEEKQQRFSTNISENVPMYVVGDELRLSQIITNLVGNAIKFTPEGGSICVDVAEIEQDARYSTLEILIKDTGIGLSKEQQAKLFTSFEQADGSITRKFGGTGLGLAICKSIIEMMGGRVWIESEVGQGSTFGFTVKMLRSTAVVKKQAAPLNKSALNALKILVVDDSPEAIEYMAHILQGFSLTCDTACNGNGAVEAAQRALASKLPYDIVFMDYLMPDFDGIEATRRIKDLSNEGTSVIMVSISDWKDIEQAARSQGILKHITKPFTPSAVLNCINEVTSDKLKLNYSQMSLALNDFSKNTILLVEDVEINREIAFGLLEDTKINIEAAVNGVEACAMFSANPDKYDLILMDIQMPEMDGLEATRQIRKMDLVRAKTIPIIAMTANAFSEDVALCKEAGMNDHVSKPIQPEILLLKLNDYLFMRDYLNRDIY